MYDPVISAVVFSRLRGHRIVSSLQMDKVFFIAIGTRFGNSRWLREDLPATGIYHAELGTI
jgi:hypothetical protein